MRPAIVKIVVGFSAFVLVFFGLQRLLVPKYASDILHGGLIREYYRSGFDHDILFIGDCEVFANFSPIALWEEFGMTSFIRGTPQQLIWQSYYLLQDTLRFETPRVIVYNVLSMQYNEPQNEAYNRLTLDGMRWGMPKIRAISASMTEEEDWLSYIFPLLRFKDRWREIGAEDFRYFFRDPRVSVNGFVIRADVRPVGWIPAPAPRANYQFGDKAYAYLERITRLAATHDIPLILVKAPSPATPWPDRWNQQIVDFAHQHDLMYINFFDYIDDIGLDFNYHTFNAGLHLNVFGAEKLARFFGGILQETFDLPDRRGEAALAARWGEKADLYHRVVARQLAEIARYGTIKNLLVE
ncbi:MAG: SGNH/GDSL hydrolase family protein [Defluviitaleaceae bacterium]|nr:SGNH/GDSL hydrolase family protein [Defluviitaleaceae bacterium]MCL2240768.1 SGNH/GDSL hydrolase family protein [Defluviitaleaceae bacterium]